MWSSSIADVRTDVRSQGNTFAWIAARHGSHRRVVNPRKQVFDLDSPDSSRVKLSASTLSRANIREPRSISNLDPHLAHRARKPKKPIGTVSARHHRYGPRRQGGVTRTRCGRPRSLTFEPTTVRRDIDSLGSRHGSHRRVGRPRKRVSRVSTVPDSSRVNSALLASRGPTSLSQDRFQLWIREYPRELARVAAVNRSAEPMNLNAESS